MAPVASEIRRREMHLICRGPWSQIANAETECKPEVMSYIVKSTRSVTMILLQARIAWTLARELFTKRWLRDHPSGQHLTESLRERTEVFFQSFSLPLGPSK